MEPADRMQLHCHCQESCVERLQQVPGRLLAHRFQLFCAGLREVLNQAGQHDYRAPCFVHPSFDGMLVQFLYADDDVIQCIALTFPEDNPIRFVMQGPEPAGNFAGRTGDYLEPVQWSMWARPMGIVFVEIVHHPALEHHGRAVDHFVSFMCPRPTNLSTARGRAPGALHVRMTGTGTLANRFWPLVQASGLTEPTHTGECARNVARLLQYPVKEFRYTVTLNEIHIESASDENPGGVRLTCANELIPEQLAFAEVAFEEASRTDEQEPLSAVTYRLVLEVLGSTGNLPMLQRQIVNNALQNHLLDDRGVKILNDKAETTLRANVLLPFCTPRTDPGHTVQRGALFHGPPGTAKSTLARCIYEHAGLRPMEIRSAASFASRYLGDTEEMLTTIFKGAHEHPDVPHVMIIEEIEALAETRSSGPDAHHAKWLTHLFSEIDKTKNVLLLCTTNRRAALDPAFTRVGRVSVEIFCGKLNAEKATDLIHSTFTKLGFAALIKEELDHELRENQVLLTNLSGAQVRGLAENVLRGYQEQGLIVRQLTASDIINHLKGALHNLIGSSNDPDLFSFSSGDAGAMFADQKSEQYLLESCENGRLSGRMLHHREHVWVEGQKQAVRELALKEPIKGPAAVYHLALLLQKISRANTATVVDSRRKEFLQHDKSPFDLVVECSENARDRGTVVIVDVDDLAGIMVDQQTQRGSSRQKAEGGMQETTAQSFHVAREHALQNIISFSRSLAQRVQPSGNTFCLCVLSTAHPFILRRLGHGMIFGLPEAPFNPPLYSQLGYEVLDSTGVSKVQRVQSGQDGFIPLVSPLVAKDAEPLLVEVTIHSIKDDLEFGFTSPVNVPSGTLVSSKSAATLTWKEWHLHSRGQSKPLKEKPEQHPDLPQVIFLIQQDSWLAVGWLSKAGAPILSEDLGVDLGGVAHPFISLKTPADTASVKVYGGLGNFPLRYLEAYQNVLAKDRGVLVFALPYSEYSESAMERLPWYEATIPDGVRTIRITACGPGGRGAKGVADQKNGAGGASGAVVDATFSVTAGAKKLCVELGAHLNPKDTNLKPASSTKIYESETGQRDIANVRRDVLLEAGGGGLQDIVGEGFAKTSDFMQLTSAVVKKGNPGEKASPMMTNSWENTPNGGAASWPKEILEMIQRKFPVIDTKNCYGQTRQQRFVPQIGGGGPGGSHNGGGIPGAFTGAPGACVIQFDPPPQATEGN